MKTKLLKNLLKTLKFSSILDFKNYMLKKAKLNEWGAVCYTEKRNGLELNYSNNCKSVYGIGGYYKGIYQNYRFN